ncbi:MAG TPA: TMEM175 family protein [Thermoleophilaceae bacterium]|jgi:uncharacterized membrane protein
MERELGRINSFSDGVMAVAITLLVLNVEVPHVGDADLPHELRELVPSIFSYGLAFALVGRYWVLHHDLFEVLRGFDGGLMWLNLMFLSLIALVPFATDLQDDYAKVPEAVAVFGGLLGLAGLVHWAMKIYVVRRGFVRDETARTAQMEGGVVALALAAVFLATIPVAFLSTVAAKLMWTATIFIREPVRRLARRRR